MKLKLLFITGSRGEWGYIRPILRLCQKRKDIRYSLCVTNMHLLPDFGLSKQEIEADGFKIDHLIYMSLDGDNHYTMVKSLGVFLSSLADVVASERPDWIILAGDRGEQLIGAIIGAFCYIPVAHIQAGELSGNIDGMTRHAIGKYAHIHFASNQDAVKRLKRLGEEPFRIHLVGAPQLDELAQGRHTSRKKLEDKYSLNLNRKYILMVQHPVTEEFSKTKQHIATTMLALKKIACPKIAVFPNNDAGSSTVKEGIEAGKFGEFHIFFNLRREDYLGFMKYAACMVGNSSSGIIESPLFNLPVVNIGTRQRNRVRGHNVIDVPFKKEAIVKALKKASSESFRRRLEEESFSPYGSGHTSEKILDILAKTAVTDKLLSKNLTY